MAFSYALPWNPGEQKMHTLLNAPEHENPTSSLLTPQAAYLLQRAPLLAVGTVDAQGRPWTSIWGGEAGFARSLGGSVMGARTRVDRRFDPVAEALFEGNEDGEVVRRGEGEEGKMVGGLTIDLQTRKRVKLYGRMVAGALKKVVGDEDEEEGGEDALTEDFGQGEVQLVVNIEQSLGNCPKYLNKKQIVPGPSHPRLISQSPNLPPEALSLLLKADLFFLSSANGTTDMSTNHRGGPPGFIRVISNTLAGAQLIYPEYSGNRLYQTLGRLQMTPAVGIVVPDLATGDVLYVTGVAEILIHGAAAQALPRSNLAVKITVIEARFVEKGLPFRGVEGEFSPYNPDVRFLPTEGSIAAGYTTTAAATTEKKTATLVAKEVITPTISRYRFQVQCHREKEDAPMYKAGQWVALDFSNHLDEGYSHMRDEDPRSLNDDFVRTFTVSSPPGSLAHDEFEITVRTVGPVTEFLSRRGRVGLDVPLLGFGGEYVIGRPPGDGDGGKGEDVIPFVAAGVGITPLLGQVSELDLTKLWLLWTLKTDDLDLVLDTFAKAPSLAERTIVFLTGDAGGDEQSVIRVETLGATVKRRRLEKADLEEVEAQTWFLCTAKSLRSRLIEWLEGKTVVFENFDY
ncbi:oxidoreductase FAD-binding protein [Aulographum hederae CBS 113979]|uniref:Oxidoreductase FAD-binding protein n=1 Tax=Aulographum hederae CBS 113979 TaxID=1176131 RepID=A0A6G1GLZ9_9PEZI|nr:oxidoreductase FAD-binding protein [Aulographum hederae CBS 113979]